MCSWTGIQPQKTIGTGIRWNFRNISAWPFCKIQRKAVFNYGSHFTVPTIYFCICRVCLFWLTVSRICLLPIRLELNIKSLSQCLLIWLWKCSQVMYEKSNILHRSVMSVRIVTNCGDVVAHLEMWWLISARLLERCSGFESGIFHNDPGALQDHCVIL